MSDAVLMVHEIGVLLMAGAESTHMLFTFYWTFNEK